MTTEPTGTEPAISPQHVPAPRPASEPMSAGGRNWPVVVGTIIMVALGIGWALLSRFVFHDAVTDSIAEGIGAALGLLIAISVIGAILSARGHRNRPEGKPRDAREGDAESPGG